MALIRLIKTKQQHNTSEDKTITHVPGQTQKSPNYKSVKVIHKYIPAGSVGDSWDLGGLPDGDPYPSGVGLSLAVMVRPALTVS